MRFAVGGELLPGHIDEFDEAHAQLVRALGFSGCFTNFGLDDPFATPDASIRRLRALLDDYGLEMVQSIGHHPSLVHPDDAFRRRGIALLQQALRIAGGLRAHTCHTGPGSLAQPVDLDTTNPARGAWSPHPFNRDPACLDRLVASLRECAPVAADYGTRIGLEGHVLVALDTPEVMRDVLDTVGSPAVRCDLDPVNWLRIDTVYASGAAIDHMVDVLGGGRIMHAHAKDVVLEPRLVTHIDECPAGQGVLDFATFMRRVEALGSDRYLVMEHTSLGDIPAAKAFLDRTAADLADRRLVAVRDGSGRSARLRLAFIGCGHHATNLLREMPFIPEIDLVAVCDLDPTRAVDAARRFGALAWYDDFERMLAAERPAAVAVIGPPQMGIEIGCRVLDAGLHLYLEKPIGRNSREARPLLDAAARSDRRTQVGFNQRHAPVMQLARQLARAPDFGRPTYMESRHWEPTRLVDIWASSEPLYGW